MKGEGCSVLSVSVCSAGVALRNNLTTLADSADNADSYFSPVFCRKTVILADILQSIIRKFKKS